MKNSEIMKCLLCRFCRLICIFISMYWISTESWSMCLWVSVLTLTLTIKVHTNICTVCWNSVKQCTHTVLYKCTWYSNCKKTHLCCEIFEFLIFYIEPLTRNKLWKCVSFTMENVVLNFFLLCVLIKMFFVPRHFTRSCQALVCMCVCVRKANVIRGGTLYFPK